MAAARGALQMSRWELARRAGYDPHTIKSWESKGIHKREQLERVAKPLFIEPADLLTDDRGETRPASVALAILDGARHEIAEVTGLPIEKIRLTFKAHELDPSLTLSLARKRAGAGEPPSDAEVS